MSAIRLLTCRDCKTAEPLPDFFGDPGQDVLLDHLVEAHVFPNGERHFGRLFRVDKADWDDSYRREFILKQLAKETTGFESEFYAARDTYLEDAQKCFKAHRRTIPCIDWESDKKRIGNPTKIGWASGPKVYLCSFCVVKTAHVDVEIKHRKGLYK